MAEAEAKTWTGGAYWHRRGRTPWSKDAVWATKYVDCEWDQVANGEAATRD